MQTNQNNHYTEEDTFNALRQTRLKRVQEELQNAIGQRYSLPHSELVAILRTNGWKLSEYLTKIKCNVK